GAASATVDKAPAESSRPGLRRRASSGQLAFQWSMVYSNSPTDPRPPNARPNSSREDQRTMRTSPTRREFIRIGGLAALGLSTAQLRGAESPKRAKSCIVLFLMGGPPQHSTWDPKPDAPAEVRGEFGPIDTNVPGVRICSL